MDKRQITKEHRRLCSILEKAGVPRQKQEVLAPVVDNMAWQRVKLDEAREEMKDASITCHYSNGGGQEGERENPIFKAYVNLWRAYMVGFEKYTSALPKELQEEAAGGTLDLLAKVMDMKKAGA